MKKAKKTFKKFEDWHPADIKQKLGVIQLLKSVPLQNWIHVSGEIPNKFTEFIEGRRISLLKHYSQWNETELFGRFISPLLETINFSGDYFDMFHERSLSAKIGGYAVSGYVDGMVASGQYEPEYPYFFIHEYKKNKGTDADPEGQLVITMLAAATLNETKEPLYGCFVMGKFWHFVYLENNEYSVSEGFDATSERELTIIWLVLEKTKKMIAAKCNEPVLE
jgi:hypothetical protein